MPHCDYVSIPGSFGVTAHNHVAGSDGQLRPAEAGSVVDRWMEWEASVLRPAVYGGRAETALSELQAALSGPYVAGASITLADVRITYPLAVEPFVHPNNRNQAGTRH
jgi:glutathione S-transferase